MVGSVDIALVVGGCGIDLCCSTQAGVNLGHQKGWIRERGENASANMIYECDYCCLTT